MQRIMKSLNKIYLTVISLGLMCGIVAAQQSPVGSGYFQQEYLFNTAQVGLRETKALDAIIRTPVGQLRDMKENYLHAMYGFGRNGVGVGFMSSRIGAFKVAEINASYAFHIPLDGESKFLSLGTGVKFLREQIDLDKIVGNTEDQALAYYNEDPNRMDLGLGLAYNSERVVLNVAVNNLFKERRDFLLNPTPFLYTSLRYKLAFEDLSIDPVLGYRRLVNDSDVFDFGASVGFGDMFETYALYHTSNNFSAGIATRVKVIKLSVAYTTTTGRVQGVGSQGLDIGLRYAW
jgi:type IX secretion system PorP/SprF family membrane protein